MRKVCFNMLKVKVTVEGQIFKLTFVQSINSTFMNGFQNNFAHLFSVTSTSVIQKVCFRRPKVKVTVEGQMFEFIVSGAYLIHLSMDFKEALHTCSP